MNSPTNDQAPQPSEHAATEPQAPGRPSGAEGNGQRGRRSRNRGGRGGAANKPAAAPTAARPAAPSRSHPVLDQLAALYPRLFGEQPRPLKRGIYQDLLLAHPEALEQEGLKVALALHTRSTRYLAQVAAGLARHDLNGQAVEAPTPEQVHHALIEVFRRRGSRSQEDLRPKLRQRILQAFEASGLSREVYAERVMGRNEEVNQLTQDALAEAAAQAAREEALFRAFSASGASIEAFAEMYGMPLPAAQRTLQRARARQQTDNTAATSG